jgi:hypothetical protein
MDLFFQFSRFCNFKQKPLRGWELKGLKMEGWKPGGQSWGQLWHLSQKEEQAKGEGKGGE